MTDSWVGEFMGLDDATTPPNHFCAESGLNLWHLQDGCFHNIIQIIYLFIYL